MIYLNQCCCFLLPVVIITVCPNLRWSTDHWSHKYALTLLWRCRDSFSLEIAKLWMHGFIQSAITGWVSLIVKCIRVNLCLPIESHYLLWYYLVKSIVFNFISTFIGFSSSYLILLHFALHQWISRVYFAHHISTKNTFFSNDIS